MSRFRYRARNEGGNALVFSFTAAFLLASSLSLTACFSRERMVLNKTVLSVNGNDISTKQFAERLALRLRNYDALFAKDESNLERVREETVQAFIIENIARTYAEKNKIRIESKEIDDEIASIRSKYPDDFAFKKALADENLPMDQWRKDVELTLLQKKIFAKITASIDDPKESEMKDYYEANRPQFQRSARVRLRQIVLEKEDDAKRIMDELGNKGDLAALAKKFSVAPEGANGGDTGWIEKGTLEVFDQAFKMNVGARSKILKSPYGYHIYEILKKEPEARLSFQEAKDKIRARLTEARAQKVFTSWLEQQVRTAHVRRDDALIRAIKVTTRGS